MAIDWVNFFFQTVSYIILLLAVPVHLLTCLTIVKNKKSRFTNSYFTLAVSLLVNDSIICAAIAIFDLLGIKQDDMPAGIIFNETKTTFVWGTAIFIGLSQGLKVSNNWAIAIIVVNRFLFVCRHNCAVQRWTGNTTGLVVALQWVVGIIFGVTCWPSARWMPASNQTNGNGKFVPNIQSPFVVWIIMFLASNALALAVTFSFNARTLFHIHRQHRALAPNLRHQEGWLEDAAKTERHLAIQATVVSLFLVPKMIPTLGMLLISRRNTSTTLPIPIWLRYLTFNADNVNYYSTSIVMLVMSKVLRKKFVEMIQKFT